MLCDSGPHQGITKKLEPREASDIDIFEATWASNLEEVRAVCAADPDRSTCKNQVPARTAEWWTEPFLYQNGVTPLHFAAEKGIDPIIETLLLANASADINVTDKVPGRSPLSAPQVSQCMLGLYYGSPSSCPPWALPNSAAANSTQC